ncbi:MAG: hypothetical protein ACE5GG_04385 [Candidatus Omnitrophota bacterium]
MISLVIVVLCGLAGALWAMRGGEPQQRHFTIQARQYAYNPARIRVRQGDTVTIKLSSKDVTHGFYLEGYDISAKIRAQYPHFWVKHPSRHDDYQQVDEITFVANRAGKFRYRCSITCGSFHPFMQGELIVEPNFLYCIGIGLAIGLALAMLAWFRERRPEEGSG